MPLKLSRAGSFAFFGGNNNRNGGRNNFTTSSSDITTSIPRQDKTNNNDSFNTAGHNKIIAPSKPSQVIPLKRRSISMEVNPQLSTKNINIGSKRLGKENTPYPKSVWYKSIFGRLNQTFKWNTPSIQQKADSEEKRFRSLKISKAVLTTDRDNEQLLVKKDNPPALYRDTTPIPSIPLSTGDSTTPTSRFNRRTSSLFEICAQTPRHNTSEAEVLGKVGRFTIVRERKDFNTTIFDQCHCAVKPCPYAESKTHPPAEAVVLSSDTSYCNSSSCSLPIKILSHPYNQRHSSPANPKPSIAVASTNGPPQRHSAHITGSSYNNSNNVPATIPLQSLVTEQQRQENHSTSFMKSISAPVISASNITTIAPLSKSENNSLPIFQSQNLYQLRHSSLPATKNESNSDIETNNTATNGTTTTNLPNTKPSRFIVHKLSNSSLNSDNSSTPTNSTPPTAQLTPTLSSHTTINSISGRKFEVEWSTDLTRVSPSSTISSIVSYAASISAQSSTSFTPSSSLSSRGSLSKGSILNGKGGRKFEVTPLERDSAGVNDVVI